MIRKKVHPYEEIDQDLNEYVVHYPDFIEEDNPVIATLLGPDGDPIIELRERRTVAFGYQKE